MEGKGKVRKREVERGEDKTKTEEESARESKLNPMIVRKKKIEEERGKKGREKERDEDKRK